MSPTLLLEKNRIRASFPFRRVDHIAVPPMPVDRLVDARASIRYRCECARPDGRHEANCILNLV